MDHERQLIDEMVYAHNRDLGPQVPLRPPQQHPRIVSIFEIYNQNPFEPEPLPPLESRPQDRILGIIMRYVLKLSRDEEAYGRSLTNEYLDSFFAEASRFMQNLSEEEFDEILSVIAPDQEGDEDRISETLLLGVVELLGLARQALRANDPQLCVSITRPQIVPARDIDAYSQNVHPVNNLMEYFGGDPDEVFLLVDSAYQRDRFFLRIDQLGEYVQNALDEARRSPDGFYEDIQPQLLKGRSNRQMRHRNEAAAISTICDAMKRLHDPSSARDLYAGLEVWIEIWRSRHRDNEFRHDELPPPPPTGSIYTYHAPEALRVLKYLRDVCQALVRITREKGTELPEALVRFAQWRDE